MSRAGDEELRNMKGRHRNLGTKGAIELLAALALTVGMVQALGCAEPEPERLPRIETTGPHAVAVGATITVMAMTLNASEPAGYTFTTRDQAVARVDKAGVVTGVTPGETALVVTGVDSKATATHAIVVIAGGAGDGGAPDGAATPPVPASQVPYYQAWLKSAHADPTSEAFTRWNKEGAVPTTCARCHSSEGFVDYLGGDGSVPGQVDKTAPIESVVRCATCHDPAATKLTSVTFPSGAKVEGLGREAVCMTCHQGRASGADVDKAIKGSGAMNDDEVSAMLSFTNIHYYPAAATLYANKAKGGYQYAGMTYDSRFRHVDGFDTCTGCHDPHAAQVRFDACTGCHEGAKDLAGLRNVRMLSSAGRDYDGDGDLKEGVYYELVGLKDKLLASIRRYGMEKNAPVCYDPNAHPYWYADGNGDGTCQPTEVVAANAYKRWTPRLAKAAYNYQIASKDPGAFAHNAKYIMELLFDSITDVNKALVVKIDMAKAVRGDRGHFDGAGTAARNWDANDTVTATCSRCHSGETGFKFFVRHGVTIDVPETANGLECTTCHAKVGGAGWDVLAVASTSFPGGKRAMQPGFDNLCSNCHVGRTGKADIDAAIAAKDFRFLNVHYLPAASVRQGAAATVGYEYEGKIYAGPLKHMGGVQCTSCHDPKASQHSFLVEDAWDARCKNCHADANGKADAIRYPIHGADYDGDGKTNEPLAAELEGLSDRLMAAISAAAGGICYGEHTFPYFFKDSDGDRKPKCSAAEETNANRFTAWTGPLMKAAHNYQIAHKDPGAWAHNFDYVGQLLYDAIEDLKGNLAGLKRP